MKKASIFFITGVNGSGKSTLVPLLKKSLPQEFAVYDFDQRGVPKSVTSQWRQSTTKYWLNIARRNKQRNRTTIICGLVLPDEVYKLEKTSRKLIKIALLEVSSQQIGKRLRQRFSSPVKIKHLEDVTGLTVRQCIEKNIEHAQALRKECKKYDCQVFNTSIVKPERTLQKVTHWILTS